MNKENLLSSLRNVGFPLKIISCFERVPREKFVRERDNELAYEDIPLDIGHGQTISQPYTIAFMLSLLKVNKNQKILEVGSGSGYVLALLSCLSKTSEIYGTERIRGLAEDSKIILKEYGNVKVSHADGTEYLKRKNYFNRILVSASSGTIQDSLIEQLKINGIMVAPVRNSIIRLTKRTGGNKIEEFEGFVFVPLLKGKG